MRDNQVFLYLNLGEFPNYEMLCWQSQLGWHLINLECADDQVKKGRQTGLQ